MKVEDVRLLNFRGIKSLDLKFDLAFTVIAGENGAGKSSVLYALSVILSHALKKTATEKIQEKKLNISDINYRSRESNISSVLQIGDSTIDVSISKSIPDKLDGILQRELNESMQKLRALEGVRSKGVSKLRSILEKDIREIRKELNKVSTSRPVDIATITSLSSSLNLNETETLFRQIRMRPQPPLAVYYSTKRFFNDGFRTLPITSPSTKYRAYAHALEDSDICLKDFAHWFRYITRDCYDLKLVQSLEETTSHFIPGFSHLEVTSEIPPRLIARKGEDSLSLTQLSDGERGLIAVVFDLTRRLALANPNLARPTLEGEAVVLIDEIDLHLHPTWQRQIVHQLQEAFPRCQFIVTTHSPQVIGEVKANQVRLLSEFDGRVVVETPGMAFGADSNWILNVLMKADGQNESVTQALVSISALLSEKDLDKASEKIAELRRTVGNTESIQRVASTLDRIRLLGK